MSIVLLAVGAVLGLWWYRTRAPALSSSKPLPTTKPAHPKTPPMTPPSQTPYGAPGPVYKTDPARAELHPSGWFPLPSGGLVTVLPLVDPDTGLFARLTYRDALAAAERFGASLLSKDQYDEIARVGFQTKPITLVHSAADGQRMATREWAEKHDAALRAQLEGHDGTTVVANAGKGWLRGAPKGRAINYGWDKDPGPGVTMIQNPGGAHDEHHTDYSQLTMLWRDAA